MKLFNHFIKKERLYYLNYIFFALVLAFAYSAGLIFLVINSFRGFYRNLETLWISILSVFVLSISDNYYQVFKDSCKHIVAIFLGGVASVASISIVGRSIWPNVFINTVFFFICTGLFLTSNFFSFLHAKNMFITYYFMVWLIHIPSPIGDYFYSPVPQLKFLSVACISLGVCMFTCLILRYSFATDLFQQTSNQILRQSSSFLKVLGKDLNLLIIKSINSDRNDYSIEEEEFYNRIRSNLFNDIPIEQPVCNRLLAKEKKSTLDDLQFIYYEYSRLLNRLGCVLKQSKKEVWSKDLFIHLDNLQILFERNHKKLYALRFGLCEDFPNEICKRILPLLPYIETLIKECNYIFCVMSKQLSLRFTHDSNNKIFQNWFNQFHNNLYHDIDRPINETNVNLHHNQQQQQQQHNQNQNHQQKDNEKEEEKIELDSSTSSNSSSISTNFNNYKGLNSILNENKDNFRINSMEWYQLEINKSFETIDKTVLKMQEIQSRILDVNFLTDLNYRDIVSRVSFFIRGFEKFSVEQKTLSSQVFLLAYHLSLTRQYPQEVKILFGAIGGIKNYFTNYKENKLKKQLDLKKELEAFPPNVRVKFTNKERIKRLIDYIIFKRILFNWLFALKYSLASSILAVAVYELTIHSRFIFFRNMEWIPIIFIVASAPVTGAIGNQTVLRLIGTIFGGFMGYAALVLMCLPSTRVAQAFIFIGFSFFTIALSFMIVKQQPFERLVIYIVFGYSVVTQFQYQTWTHQIIPTLLRICHICIGIIFVAIVGYILPYYDYRQLEKNLYQLPFGIIKTFTFLMSFSFIDSSINQSNNNNNSEEDTTDFSNDISGNNNLSDDDNDDLSSQTNNSLNSSNDSNYLAVWKNDNIIPNISKQGLSFQQYRLLLSKVYIELRTNFPIQRTLLLDAQFELTFRRNKYERIEHIFFSIQQLHNIFGALDFIVSESNQISLQCIGSTVKDKLFSLLVELNVTSQYLYNLASFEKDRFRVEQKKPIDRDNSLLICNDLINTIRTKIGTCNLCILKIQHLNAIIFILNQFITQYNLVFNLLYDFIERVNIKKIKTNNYNITKPNEVQNLEDINYHCVVGEDIKDVKNYQILKILK
ncbi:hypothetical protein RB653_009079 [Dictyostelium firmibasis]|uniref:Integral membrane bound transporter domain-containing protein n=1 Tax=Dictyostelium firmibasis TaxID=79012 RepID=A0AAN7YUQ0_9MYCE